MRRAISECKCHLYSSCELESQLKNCLQMTLLLHVGQTVDWSKNVDPSPHCFGYELVLKFCYHSAMS